MQALTRDDLYTLEAYAAARTEFRTRVMEHKRLRAVPVGPHATLYFEDRLTIQYQIQEMLRAERIFEPDGIAEELAAYNPLIPDGHNLKATLMIEYPDEAERREQLARLGGIEHRVWIEVAGQPRTFAIADEDLERSDQDKTSAVHFLRFEFDEASRGAFKGGAAVRVGIDHDAYAHAVELAEAVRETLARDFD